MRCSVAAKPSLYSYHIFIASKIKESSSHVCKKTRLGNEGKRSLDIKGIYIILDLNAVISLVHKFVILYKTIDRTPSSSSTVVEANSNALNRSRYSILLVDPIDFPNSSPKANKYKPSIGIGGDDSGLSSICWIPSLRETR